MSRKRKKLTKLLAQHKKSGKPKTPIVLHVKKDISYRKYLSFTARALAGIFAASIVLVIVQAESKNKGTVLGTGDTSFAEASSSAVPSVKVSVPPPPDLSAVSAISVSTKKNKILYSKNIDLKLPPASTTKILTGLLAIREFDLDEVIEVPVYCTLTEGSKMGLFPGEKINVESLLYGLLVSSAGDAACTLSEHKFSSGAFLVKMNNLARAIGLSETNFTNVIGLDTEDGAHLSSARDLYLMAMEALKNGTFRKIVGTKEITLTSADKKYFHNLVSTNLLLFEIPGSLGVKTGKTELAKEVLVYAYQYKDDEIVTVVMGSDSRFEDTKALIRYTTENYKNL